MTEVRSPHRPLLPDTVGPELQKPTSLRGIAKKAKADTRHRFRDLYRCLEAELLLACWQGLHKEAASGVDQVTADTYAANLQGNIEALVQRLKTKRYRTKLVRRCYIPKANGTERPLGIPALEDKLVVYPFSFATYDPCGRLPPKPGERRELCPGNFILSI